MSTRVPYRRLKPKKGNIKLAKTAFNLQDFFEKLTNSKPKKALSKLQHMVNKNSSTLHGCLNVCFLHLTLLLRVRTT